MSPKIFVVVVTYRRREGLPVVLELATTQSQPPECVVVVDNAPHPENEAAVDRARTAGLTVEYLPTPENEGPAGGRGRGMRRVLELGPADDDWILTIDDDSVSEDGASFARILDFARSTVAAHPETGAVARGGARFDRRRAIVSRIPTAELSGTVEVDTCATGGVPMYRVVAVRAVGTFDERLFFGHEELEYCLRLAAGGFRLFSDGEWHREGRTRRADDGERRRRALAVTDVDWRRFYSTRNLVWIARQHCRRMAVVRVALRSTLKPLVNLPRRPRVAWTTFRFQVRAVRDGYRGTLGRTVEPSALGSRAATSYPDPDADNAGT